MTVDTCAAPECGNLAEWTFTTPAHTLHTCDRHMREIEATRRPDGGVQFADLPAWAQPEPEAA